MKATDDMEQVIKKLKALPPERLEEIEDFIDFISQRTNEQRFTTIALAASESTLARIWNNSEDAVYDEL